MMLIVPHYLDSDIAESKLYHRLSGLSSMAKIRTLNVVQSTDKIKTASQYTNSLVNCESQFIINMFMVCVISFRNRPKSIYI